MTVWFMPSPGGSPFWRPSRRLWPQECPCSAGRMPRLASVQPCKSCFILLGWALSQYPYLVVPDLTVSDAAAPAPVLQLLLWSLAIGALLLFPSLYYLYRIFKTHTFRSPESLRYKVRGELQI